MFSADCPKGDPNGAIDEQAHQEKAIKQAQKKTGAKTAADIWSRPRLPLKKKLTASKQPQQEAITRVDKEESGGAEGQTIDNKQLANQTSLLPPPSPLKTQTDRPSSNRGNHTRSNTTSQKHTTSQKLHDLGEG
ncbi:hypothetical protein PTTG_02723, partial [Puccinia triticina 1-1 BBBD Race 1]